MLAKAQSIPTFSRRKGEAKEQAGGSKARSAQAPTPSQVGSIVQVGRSHCRVGFNNWFVLFSLVSKTHDQS